MALNGALLRMALFFASAVAALAQSVRGVTDAAAIAAAEFPMHEVPMNKHSDLAIASIIAAVAVPVLALGVMFWLKEKAWWGACYLIGGLIFLMWLFCAYIAL
mmetsp:Transcript_76193/g.210737  ORF Transcript_76193/g.210737 Transcript_76193/m.210737 type:complete len:103 (+) Transcript_76193:68-376(+)